MASASAGAAASPGGPTDNSTKPTKPNTPMRNSAKQHQANSNKSSDSPSTANPASNGSNQRPPSTDDPILLAIASKQSTMMQQLVTITCYIPSSSVGAVIGRRGATIAQIQRQAHQAGTSSGPVRLSIVGHQAEQQQQAAGDDAATPADMAAGTAFVDSTTAGSSAGDMPAPMAITGTTSASSSSSVPYTYCELDWSSPDWTPVVIRADPCAALTAAQLLRDKAEQLDDVVLDIPLGRAKHAALVGRRGFVLANLSADTNVRIMVPRRELRHDVVQLEGDLTNVKQCLARVLTIVSDATSKQKKAPATFSTPTNKQQQQQQPVQQAASDDKGAGEGTAATITLPAMPSRTKMRNVINKTGANIRKKKAGDNWDLTITGTSEEQVWAAVSMLRKWGDDSSTDAGQVNNNKNDNSSNSINNSSNSNSNSGTPSRPRGRGRQQGRSTKGGKGRNNNKPGKAVETSANP